MCATPIPTSPLTYQKIEFTKENTQSHVSEPRESCVDNWNTNDSHNGPQSTVAEKGDEDIPFVGEGVGGQREHGVQFPGGPHSH